MWKGHIWPCTLYTALVSLYKLNHIILVSRIQVSEWKLLKSLNQEIWPGWSRNECILKYWTIQVLCFPTTFWKIGGRLARNNPVFSYPFWKIWELQILFRHPGAGIIIWMAKNNLSKNLKYSLWIFLILLLEFAIFTMKMHNLELK